MIILSLIQLTFIESLISHWSSKENKIYSPIQGVNNGSEIQRKKETFT
jgi:hypothetical protein